MNIKMATPKIRDTAHVVDGDALSFDDHRIGRLRLIWRVILAFSGIGGFGSGITGLILSGLTFMRLADPRSGIRIAVPMLVVLCLSLLMMAAHAMDRLRDLNAAP